MVCCCSVAQLCPTLQPLQHARLPCPSPSPEVCSVQFSSVTQSCLTLCDPMNRSTPGLPVHHQLLEFAQTHVHWSVMPMAMPISSTVIHFSSCPQSCPASVFFQMSQFFTSGGQSIGVSASASVLPRPQFSNTTVQKHQFFSTQLSL